VSTPILNPVPAAGADKVRYLPWIVARDERSEEIRETSRNFQCAGLVAPYFAGITAQKLSDPSGADPSGADKPKALKRVPEFLCRHFTSVFARMVTELGI
jgi:hypothetical protein